MSKEEGTPVRLPPRPTTSDHEAWNVYWTAQGQPWRKEPEIDQQRQRELAQHRAIAPVSEQGIYPFKGMKLSRADIEWLLATHEDGRGPVDWQDVGQRAREGLDLRGVDVRNVDLHQLPLTRIKTGHQWLATLSDWLHTPAEVPRMAAIHLEGANLKEAHLEGASLINAALADASLVGAYLQQADLSGATLEDASLVGAQMQEANLTGAYLIGTNLRYANLSRANLTGAYFDPVTEFADAVLGETGMGFTCLADISWGGTDLTAIDWRPIRMPGEEEKARTSHQLTEYQTAVRANRQLAVALQSQGLNEDASRFTYRAQVLQRQVLWKQRSIWKWLGSALLAVLAGYGYRMWRILVAYLLVVLLCAVAYFELSAMKSSGPPLSFMQSVLISITAFHGRVFSEPFTAGEPQLWVTAFEAVAGLVIEGVFIAMLAQRFFGK